MWYLMSLWCRDIILQFPISIERRHLESMTLNIIFSVVVGGRRMQRGMQTIVLPLGAWGHDR
jgi:hypothetical protein